MNEELTGEALYALWVRANNDNSISVDEWDDLNETDQMCWEQVAAMVYE